MKSVSLLFTIAVGILITGRAVHYHTTHGLPKYDRKVEGEWIAGTTLKWPLDGSDGSHSRSRETGKLLLERLARSTEMYPMPEHDMEVIRKIVSDKLPKQNPKVGAIRKVSETEYVVDVSLEEMGYDFILVKSRNGWTVLGWYLDWIS